MTFSELPLAGKRVLITRSAEGNKVLTTLFSKEGAEVFSIPTIQTVAPRDSQDLDRAIESIKSYGLVLLTSVNGVTYFLDRLELRGSMDSLKKIPLAVIGPKTARALRDRGLTPSLIPKDAHAGEELAETVTAEFPLAGARVLWPRAREARDVLPERLRAQGAQIHVVTSYETVPNAEARTRVTQVLSERFMDWATFHSGSAVEAFVQLGGADRVIKWFRETKVRIAALGRITSEALLSKGLSVAVMASEPTSESLVKAVRIWEQQAAEG